MQNHNYVLLVRWVRARAVEVGFKDLGLLGFKNFKNLKIWKRLNFRFFKVFLKTKTLSQKSDF